MVMWTTSGSGIINVISNPKIGDIDSYTRLAMAAKENNSDGYTKIARVISEAFDDNLKEKMSSLFVRDISKIRDGHY